MLIVWQGRKISKQAIIAESNACWDEGAHGYKNTQSLEPGSMLPQMLHQEAEELILESDRLFDMCEFWLYLLHAGCS